METGASSLSFSVDEKTALLGANVAGNIEVIPEAVTGFEGVLDENDRHFWYPLAPRIRVKVNLRRPSLSWCGTGYLDMNRGSEPLEEGFRHWNWSRANLKDEAAIIYDLTRRSGTPLGLCLHIAADGTVETRDLPPPKALPRTPMWRMRRSTRCDARVTPRTMKTLEDTPFYSRSVISTQIFGESAVAMHESLSLDRFKTKAVQTMLPYRMPRTVI